MQYGDEIAVTDSEKKITYLELNQKAICIGQYFMEKGICKDDKVLVQMPNRISFVAVLFALAKIRTVPIMMLPAHREAELEGIIALAKPTAYVVAERYLGFSYVEMAMNMQKKFPCIQNVFVDGVQREEWYEPETEGQGEFPEVDSYSTAVLLLPGGTTGVPKLIPRAHTDYMYKCQNDEEKEIELQKQRKILSHKVYDHEKWPLFTFQMIESPNSRILMVSLDLMVCDGDSMQILFTEIADTLEGKSDAEKIEYSYAEYIQNISNQKNSESYEEDKAYWLNKIDSLSSYPQIPMKMKLADCRDYNIVRKSAIIDSVLWGNFKETARRHKVSPSALLCTLYGRIMAKWGNQSEVLLNLTVFQRQQKNTEKIIGDFTKLLPLNLVFAKEDIWKSAERVQEQIMKELDHLSFDGTEIMRELAKRRGVFGKALLPVVFTCVLFDCPENYFERLGSIKYAVSQTPQVFLDNQITEMGGRLHISWDVVDELFEACIIDEIFLEFVEDIKRISENNKANSTNDFVTKVWGNILTKEIITKSVVPDLLKNIDLKQIKILDYAQELCPPDVKGQVYVSESEIMNDRNKTYYKILEHPLYGRMADTGIIGVLTHDGYMEFVVPNCETSVETPDKKEDTHEEEIEKPIVKEIMKIWKEVFEIEDISIQDDFYTLGGDSIILMRLVDEMCKTLGCDVTVDDILQSENISDLANRV